MKVKDLIKELKKSPPDAEVNFKGEVFDCSGHGPDEYCYCSNKNVSGYIESVSFDYHKNPYIEVGYIS